MTDDGVRSLGFDSILSVNVEADAWPLVCREGHALSDCEVAQKYRDAGLTTDIDR